ncbi:MAG TPA: hypothetical protein VEB21_07950 [Terriglobales bacterium]|nr:hypothetical protein [Terriglobales bacterium]
MALDLAGIENVEFYSGHYLQAVLEGDLKQVFERWKNDKEEHGRKPPFELLHGLANRYFQTVALAEDARDDAAERWRLARGFHAHLIEALGYAYEPDVVLLDGDDVCPVLLELRRDGLPYLWIIDAGFALPGEDALTSPLLPEQLPAAHAKAKLPRSKEKKDDKYENAGWRELLDGPIFRLDPAPRWLLFLGGREIQLIERSKWPQGRYLRFDLTELFSRRQPSALRAMAALLHRDVLAPGDRQCLHDSLDESSHKHAFAVSSDLKHGLRRAVELLANEAVWYRREVQKLGVFNQEELADKLTSESLTWLYRLLFLFYVESRGAELGVVPMSADAYRQGYSLEGLRDLEQVPLTSERARNGYFLHDSLRTLFAIIDRGFPEAGEQTPLLPSDSYHHDTFTVTALHSPLFDDERLEILRNVRFRNCVLQEVLQLLSLSAEKKGKQRGRISYAQLGINQLGAVYEGILSYSGFFAVEDLYEVASEDECKKLSGKSAAEREALKTYFVPASRIGDYKESEIVRDERDKKVVHPRGAFIFRLAGRNREKSASYYTPEVLTRCLVKYALKELLGESSDPLSRKSAGEGEGEGSIPKSAAQILDLTICEPAMGSSAFLIEAIDQLADAYLERRQQEVGKIIAAEDYQREKRRVKARLATNNCYGVDLNPTAVELAKVSLWLATLHEDGKCPWFGLRLAVGNSLVGARREVFETEHVLRKGSDDNLNWLERVPVAVPLWHGAGAPAVDAHWDPPARPKGTIYHFLLPARGMAAFDSDAVVKELAPEQAKHISEWRKRFCAPFDRTDATRLEKLSDAVDRLFGEVVRERALAANESSDRIAVWEEPGRSRKGNLLVRDQEAVARALEDRSSAYRRLKLVMDSWCALWFWPIEQARLLPERGAWLAMLELLLLGQVTHKERWEQQDLFGLGPRQGELELPKRVAGVETPTDAGGDRLEALRALSEKFRRRRLRYSEECGLADVEAILAADPTLQVAQQVADRLRFHHWHLRFAEVFAERGGFNLILGNPPWVKLQWQEGSVLSDFVPYIAIRDMSAHDVATKRFDVLRDVGTRAVLP